MPDMTSPPGERMSLVGQSIQIACVCPRHKSDAAGTVER